ncbi:hypothetical protein RQM47_00040 [Rubrivirga sp. S365]|uniref:DUF4149 domain-containing protein n=1 Tax=Rubrivirga litoralis TaxID=3075598 RepID=A0ABU3BP13_9BACT|nr:MULTISPECIES: hypothetical protein [unclassified Rubrivirga]MDT0630998.1 hypothetical protein [Rubrivirga sp. F394]MDT7855024.1 hypothetical protein [Rubrivirga sp. S365]
MTGRTAPLVAAAYAVAAAVLACGVAYPFAAEALRPGPVAATLPTVLRSAGWAAGPAAALLLAARWAGRRPLAAWAALVGGLLVLALGFALYASALQSPRAFAPAVALRFVPLRQLAAAAFVVWAVWIARRVR